MRADQATQLVSILHTHSQRWRKRFLIWCLSSLSLFQQACVKTQRWLLDPLLRVQTRPEGLSIACAMQHSDDILVWSSGLIENTPRFDEEFHNLENLSNNGYIVWGWTHTPMFKACKSILQQHRTFVITVAYHFGITVYLFDIKGTLCSFSCQKQNTVRGILKSLPITLHWKKLNYS